MDSQKTGQLIAQQRGALGLTQKQLADQLHISDRTVSRWERGVGYPDLSLLEPLADALGLSVVELLRGERLPPEQQPTPQAEHTARDVLNSAGERSVKQPGVSGGCWRSWQLWPCWPGRPASGWCSTPLRPICRKRSPPPRPLPSVPTA